jgi:predicted transcriptional regulator of viral defense system
MYINLHMQPEKTQKEKVIDLVKRLGVVRVRDLSEKGLHHESLRRLCKNGVLIKTGRGLYELADADVTEHHSLSLIGKKIPNAVVCLLSALQFHDIGTQSPSIVWIAIDRRAGKPKMDYPPLRIVRFTGLALDEGVEKHDIEGVTVKIYNPAKTVADCFKYRNKIGLDVALEALRECLREQRCTNDELWHYAKVCRVANVMRPYLEAVV